MCLFRHSLSSPIYFFFFFNDTATTEIYTLSLHDALPIYQLQLVDGLLEADRDDLVAPQGDHLAELSVGEQVHGANAETRSEEHTSELQSQSNLVCRLLLEKKKDKITVIA